MVVSQSNLVYLIRTKATDARCISRASFSPPAKKYALYYLSVADNTNTFFISKVLLCLGIIRNSIYK